MFFEKKLELQNPNPGEQDEDSRKLHMSTKQKGRSAVVAQAVELWHSVRASWVRIPGQAWFFFRSELW